MNINSSASIQADHLHRSLVKLARADMARDYLCIRAKNQHGLANIQVNQLHMGMILHGQKQLTLHHQQVNLSAGDLFIIKPDTVADTVNIPDPETGEYLSILVPMCEEVIQAAQMIWAKAITDKTEAILRFSIHDFALHLLSWQTALFEQDLVKARLSIAAILVQLCQQQCSDVLIVPAPQLSKRIYQWVLEQPQHAWQSSEIEARLGLSSATLRRKLSQEQTSLREIITRARLAYALELLYSNKLPMKTIAAKSGYQSVATFRARFMQRYQIDPNVLAL
ncbi:helix-turn-helix transcriptional regulator [Acinetobacter courvalinii]|uniref:helix-turn-helix transcriptional regulator n=1 Tax=Acinetobacter courvalinii TaxID=280147 RepID=UPI0021D0A353|nr:AraC family transcriptional regulator [Acinetobacter courvalinii]MCU4639630.1 AraC family transcriptional regulator [Acinetobacter courvalinii]